MKILNATSGPLSIWNSYMRGGYTTWPIGQDCETHFHEDAAEVFVFLEGACEITVGDETQVVPAGQTVYVGPGEPHKLKSVGDVPLLMFLVVCPNHEPTHTFLEPDGTLRRANAKPPPT